MKVVALIARRPDLSREAFRRHYETRHVPLALRHIDGSQGYVRNHVTREIRGGNPGFDAASEFWYADAAALGGVVEMLEGPRGRELREDEERFMDRARNVFFPVTERHLLGPRRGPGPEAAAGFAALLRRPRGETLPVFLADYARGPLADLLRRTDPLRCVQNARLADGDDEAPFDCITQLWYSDPRAALAALARWRPAAGRLLLLGVSEHATCYPRGPTA
jgi:uncharacterized protein (TIGR02118 family)